MTTEIEQICKYLIDILQFRNYIEIPDDKSSYFTISDEELKSGKLEISNGSQGFNLIKKWYEAQNKIDKKNNNGKDETRKKDELDDESEVNVVLIPKIVSDVVPSTKPTTSKIKGQIWEYKRVSLLYIKASIFKKGDSFELKIQPGESFVWADPLILRPEEKVKTSFLQKILNALFRKIQNNANEPGKFELSDSCLPRFEESKWEQVIDSIADNYKKRTGKSFYESNILFDNHRNPHKIFGEVSESKNGDGSESKSSVDSKVKTIVMHDSSVFASRPIIDLINAIITKVNRKSYVSDIRLLENVLIGSNKEQITFTHEVGENICNHLGQMKNGYPLAAAQREAVHCFSKMENGDVLAVSGPPGTGKTSMLQSIVADMLVKMFLDKNSSVPLILASSANNKAILNIIDAFSSDKEDPNLEANIHQRLHQRWICYGKGRGKKFVPMAVYCPSSSAYDKNKEKYFMTNRDGGYNYAELREEYSKSQDDFFNRARTALAINCTTDITVVKNKIQEGVLGLCKTLKDIEDILQRNPQSREKRNEIIEDLFQKYDAIESVEECKGKFDKQTDKCIGKYDECIDLLLDLTIRYDLYWYVVHFNECLWIERIQAAKKDSKPPYGKCLWEEIKYICPCIISTFYMAPKLFSYNRKGNNSQEDKSENKESCKLTQNYNFGLADLLIVDEAGQVSPEIGLPTFALAKKAIVVGDVDQIHPVYSVAESSEENYWSDKIKSLEIQNDREYLSCCGSSIMKLAQKRCRYTKKDVDGGLFLNEHRRCVDEIISYSNELMYKGRLVPKRGNSAVECPIKSLPPVGIYNVEGTSELNNGSRCNKKEIDDIAKWIKQHASEIEKAYENKSIRKIINIITPFKAQSELIRKDEYLRDFPSGTVHTFQGAESPIVIFSIVYGDKDTPAFIMNNHNLMNVAVSRAKDHFIVFGSVNCLKNNKSDKACRLLLESVEDIKAEKMD